MPNTSSFPAVAWPGGKKRTFALTAEQRDAAQAWVEFGERTPSKPRFASSVVLLKDTSEGLKTFMTYRRGQSPLGVVAFPGGTVDPADDDVTDWVGPSPAQWAKAMGIADVDLAKRHVVAAIRETFEETGVLLAGPDASSMVEGIDGPEWMKARESIASQEWSFAELLDRRGLALRTDLIKPLSHWVSPDFMHRRFDTRYFTAALPVNQTPSLLESKGVWGRWVSATEVVDGRSTTALGDEAGQPNTVGLTLPELLVPGVEVILDKLAISRGCIAYLNHKRPLIEFKPALVEAEDGTLELEIKFPSLTEGPVKREL